MDSLANAAGHEDRHLPLKSYCKGLLLEGDRKASSLWRHAWLRTTFSRCASLCIIWWLRHHGVMKRFWRKCASRCCQPCRSKDRWWHGSWIAGFPKKGKHSVGVSHQYCGQLGKQENCRVAVSLSVATWSSSLPIAYHLYLPKEWAEDAERREKAEVPQEIQFQTKPDIAMDQIRAAVAADVARGIVLADAAYGNRNEFRDSVTELGLQYVVGVQSSMTVWEPDKQPLPAKLRGKMGRPPRLLHRSPEHQPVSVKQLAMSLPCTSFKNITWREGTEHKSLRAN